MLFELPELPYAYDALAPYMSKETLEYHHDKHQKAYAEKTNELIAGSGLEGKSLEEVIKAAHQDLKKETLFNNAAQLWNHTEFWKSMTPKGGKIPGEVEARIKEELGGIQAFRKDFVAQGVADFGSGWVWLVLDKGKLAIVKTANAVNPLVLGNVPLLACDVWEHAYYIDYRNRREEFLKAFVDHLINWEYVAELLNKSSHQPVAA